MAWTFKFSETKFLMLPVCFLIAMLVADFKEIEGHGWCNRGEIVRLGGGRMLDHPIDLCGDTPHVPNEAMVKFFKSWGAIFAVMSVIVVVLPLPKRWV